MLEQEGFHHNENHLDLLERELNLKYNTAKHVLLWNRRTGKTIDAEDEGKLECLKCGRQWRWKDRICNLPRTKCVDKQPPKVPKRIQSKLPVSRIFASSTASSSSVLPRVGVG